MPLVQTQNNCVGGASMRSLLYLINCVDRACSNHVAECDRGRTGELQPALWLAMVCVELEQVRISLAFAWTSV